MDTQASTYIVLQLAESVKSVHDRMEIQSLQVLTLIARTPGITQKEVSHKVDIDVGAVGRNIDMLGPGSKRGPGRGLVERYTDMDDRRSVHLRLTDKGREFWAYLEDTLGDAVERTTKKEAKA